MARSNVPKFGNWENEDDVPYTVYFDKARKNRGGKMINPNDPQENPDMFPAVSPPTLSPSRPKMQPDGFIGRGTARQDLDVRQGHPPARNQNQRAPDDLSNGPRKQKPAFDQSPLHPQQQANGGARTTRPAAWDGRNHESSHGSSAVRPHQKPAARPGDESPVKGTVVPKFGAWDAEDPQSAEMFTDIFKKVRDEKNAGPGNPSSTPKHQSYVIHNRTSKQPKKCCCFGW